MIFYGLGYNDLRRLAWKEHGTQGPFI
jgi:hypothetical protein